MPSTHQDHWRPRGAISATAARWTLLASAGLIGAALFAVSSPAFAVSSPAFAGKAPAPAVALPAIPPVEVAPAGPIGRNPVYVPADALPAGTTLVDYNALPTPPAPAVGPAQAAAASRGTSGDSRNAVIWVVLVLALLAGVPAAIRVIRLR
jgi:hypothetical protein